MSTQNLVVWTRKKKHIFQNIPLSFGSELNLVPELERVPFKGGSLSLSLSHFLSLFLSLSLFFFLCVYVCMWQRERQKERL